MNEEHPDPTLMTTTAILREVAASHAIITTRLDAMDKALDVLTAIGAKSPSIAEVDLSVKHLTTMVGMRFDEWNKRTEQKEKDNASALAAAFSAAKGAVEETNKSRDTAILKSEVSMTENLKQYSMMMQTMKSELDSKITDLKERTTMIESKALGANSEHGRVQGSQVQWVGIIGLALGAAVAISGFVLNSSSKSPPVAYVERPLP